MIVKPGYTFDDVLLLPKYSEIRSRSEVDISVDLGKGVKLTLPIVSANMSNVTGSHMAGVLAGQLGCLPILHRFYTTHDELIEDYKRAVFCSSVFSAVQYPVIAASVGVQAQDKELVAKLVDAGCKVICIDVAHGDHLNCRDMTSFVAKTYPDVLLIAGNVATGAAAAMLANDGADVIKVGVGGGSLCTTRIETGNGVPQLSALEDVYSRSTRMPKPFKVIADGGIRQAGDIVKALCFSHAVMLGNLLAGTDEAPGKVTEVNGIKYKEYVGSSTHKSQHVEGVRASVKCKGGVARIIDHLIAGLRSGCSYQGAENLAELRDKPQFISISSAGLKESHPHDIFEVK